MSAERVPIDQAVDDGIGRAGMPGRPTGFCCPRCGGVLGEVSD